MVKKEFSGFSQYDQLKDSIIWSFKKDKEDKCKSIGYIPKKPVIKIVEDDNHLGFFR